MKWLKTEAGEILCPICLKAIHHTRNDSADDYIAMQSLDVDETFVVERDNFEKDRNSFMSRAQYIKRTYGKRFKVTTIKDLNKIVIRRTK